MKQLNYDTKYLIYQNLKIKFVEQYVPVKYSQAQYRLLCRIIKQRHITKEFFDFLMVQLFDFTDWKNLNYKQMYQLIFILINWNY